MSSSLAQLGDLVWRGQAAHLGIVYETDHKVVISGTQWSQWRFSYSARDHETLIVCKDDDRSSRVREFPYFFSKRGVLASPHFRRPYAIRRTDDHAPLGMETR